MFRFLIISLNIVDIDGVVFLGIAVVNLGIIVSMFVTVCKQML